eukprot:10273287-Lingulodinium_polyedra.AAC.1
MTSRAPVGMRCREGPSLREGKSISAREMPTSALATPGWPINTRKRAPQETSTTGAAVSGGNTAHDLAEGG